MGRFIYNLSPDTFTAANLSNNRPFGYLLAPNNASPQLVELAGQVRGAGLALMADNGNFAFIGKVRGALRERAAVLREHLVRVEDDLGRSVRAGEVPEDVQKSFLGLSVEARELARQLASNGESSLGEQVALGPTHLIGVEDITAACWLALDLERVYMGRRSRDWRRMNESVARRASRRLRDLPASVRSSYYPVASAESYNTAYDAGVAFAAQGVARVSMGFGAYMADANYRDYVVIRRRRIDFAGRLPNRYTRTVLVARGFWDGYRAISGGAPAAFHCLGLGAPIMLPLVALVAGGATELSFDATSPIKDALRDGILYVTTPAYMKIRIRRSAGWLASDATRTWDCPCAFCRAFAKKFPFNYAIGHAWRAANPDREPKAADLREGGALYEAYPLFSEPPGGPRRDAVDHARIGHNHWAIEQILGAVSCAAGIAALASHVERVVDDYAATTTPPFAQAVAQGLAFALDPKL
ncbi:hypothetical protein [Mycobacterium decipiens]|uniref:tRNA-guanine(15) transglycosylase-like domain-containing protein n=1 Tax=Mycobacterium decipiens TaxID=1430326 RepID=A0A1X2LTQ6_9MYCO|nr:hypothetical protein [Mycobacterium decipiens]OSC40277.1 hypothetical protein B8W66_13225 [Mycobacterium decipiens]